MDKPDIATLIDSRFEEMTDLEQEIARYFLQAETIQDDLSSQQVTQKLHLSQAALTRFAKKVWFYRLSRIYFPIPAPSRETRHPFSQAQSTDKNESLEVIVVCGNKHRT